jgi:hypothetical protein
MATIANKTDIFDNVEVYTPMDSIRRSSKLTAKQSAG